ncbi:MAG: hypothetical protein U0X73_12960 [Thermoanaerobaculia bacterium]
MRVRVVDETKRRLLRDLERAVVSALGESQEVHKTLAALRRAGYQLHLLLDCEAAAGVTPTAAARAPEFRINSQDLEFLRTLGIDPTRKRRARRA